MSSEKKGWSNEWIAFGVTSGLTAAGLLMRLLSKPKSALGSSRIFESTDLRKTASDDGHGGIVDNAPDLNLPLSAEGRTMHVQTKLGEMANRVLTVGDAGRAVRITKNFDNGGKCVHVGSSRGYNTYTGMFKGVPVTVVAIGMGVPMMDFAVREIRAAVRGTLAMLRLGSCGGLGDAKPGCLVVGSKGAVLLSRRPDLLHHGDEDEAAGGGGGRGKGGDGREPPLTEATAASPYDISKTPVLPDAELSALYASKARKQLDEAGMKEVEVREGVVATADGFYAPQGRVLRDFDDRCTGVVDRLEKAHPDALSLEMEHFTLLDVARSARPQKRKDGSLGPSIRAAVAAVPLVSRRTGKWATSEHFATMEVVVGRAALDALVSLELEDAMSKEELLLPPQ